MRSTHPPLASLPNNLFLDGFNTSSGWLLVTRTRGAWWCRYRGHCRSGPRHLSPRSRVCAQEWHWKDIHSYIHSHTPMHTPKKAQKQQQQNAQLTKHDVFVYWSSSYAVCCWLIFRKLGTCSTTDALWARTLLTENICESVQQILQHSPVEKKKQYITKQNKNDQEAWQMLLRTFHAEDFSPRTVLTKNICRCVHHMLQHFSTTMPFLTVSPITYSWMASTPPQADSWWHAHSSKTKTLNSRNMTSFTSPLPVQCSGTELGRCSSWLLHVGGLLSLDSNDRKQL